MLEVIKKGGLTYYRQTQLKELLSEVDSFPGEPSREDIRRLAEKYGETEWYIETTFRTRRWREEQRRSWRKDAARLGRKKKGRDYPWLQEEIELVRDQYHVKSDRALADELSRLPCNVARGATRTPKMVLRLRERKGWRKNGNKFKA